MTSLFTFFGDDKHLSNLLFLQWERAIKVLEMAEENLGQLFPIATSDNYATIEKWISEDLQSYTFFQPTSKCQCLIYV